ncbi:DUF6748 domain-containing protein [Mastigocoleus sp. MO_188.B34]|uniref:DUF6748 domain-containing protein n=1 Tax=Mastigocoleus sp. MO_188.B34 TaxID=3036635 RepID=UPI002630DFED|nr:DUF6748 domain-containing protein [Mastigocoleus sp. MO_188.B34]MDJ0697504.1 hypothetical protein [Mastigocoleus sp. MO_188.B34]
MNKKLIYYKYRLILLLGTFIASFGFLAKTHAQDLGKTEKFPQWGYYTVRRDFRKCASPICGGFFIKQNNLKATPCLDGIFRDQCYVSSIDWSGLKLGLDELLKLQNQDPSRLLLRGSIVPVEFPGIGEFGELKVKEAFITATDTPRKGTFVVLKNNGIVCVTTPCFSTDKFVLNKPNSSQVSSIDLSQTDGTAEQIEAARKEIFAKGLIVVGRIKNVDDLDPTKRDIKFVGKQFYLRVEQK